MILFTPYPLDGERLTPSRVPPGVSMFPPGDSCSGMTPVQTEFSRRFVTLSSVQAIIPPFRR